MTLCIKYHYAEFHYTECRILFIGMLNVIMLSIVKFSAVMQSVVKMSAVMPSVILLIVVMLSVLAPWQEANDMALVTLLCRSLCPLFKLKFRKMCLKTFFTRQENGRLGQSCIKVSKLILKTLK
jgi:hypothetical protein